MAEPHHELRPNGYRVDFDDGTLLLVPPETKREVADLTVGALDREIESRLTFQHEIASNLFKGLYLLHGGSIIGLLTYLGNARPSIEAKALGFAFLAFAVGLALNTFAQVRGYDSQSDFMKAAAEQRRDALRLICENSPANSHRSHEVRGTSAHNKAKELVVASGVFFVIGSLLALLSLAPNLGT